MKDALTLAGMIAFVAVAFLIAVFGWGLAAMIGCVVYALGGTTLILWRAGLLGDVWQGR